MGRHASKQPSTTAPGARCVNSPSPDYRTPRLAVRRLINSAGLLLVCAATFSFVARAAEDSEVIAVSSHASEDYVRSRLPDGTFATETYAFGEGGAWNAPMRDSSFDKVRFIDTAQIIARPLATQNYFPSRDPKQTKLLIMVYWGMTTGSSGASGSLAYQALQSGQPIQALKSAPPPPPSGVSKGAVGQSSIDFGQGAVEDGSLSARDFAITMITTQNVARDMTDLRNAGILGYDTDLRKTEGLDLTAMRWRRQSLIEDLEDNRYFVVLMAYDFQLLWKEKKHKLLWDARFSIRERDNEFDKQLESMTQAAARYFGRNSGGIQRHDLPVGEVKMDEVKILGPVPAK